MLWQRVTKKFRVTLPKSHVEKEFATIDVLGYAINSMSLTEILLNVPERHKKNGTARQSACRIAENGNMFTIVTGVQSRI